MYLYLFLSGTNYRMKVNIHLNKIKNIDFIYIYIYNFILFESVDILLQFKTNQKENYIIFFKSMNSNI